MDAIKFITLFWLWMPLIVSLMFLLRPSELKELKLAVIEDRGMRFMYAFASIFLGLATVLVHNIWEASWHTTITVLAWLCLLKGIYLIVYPEPSKKTSTEARVLSTRIALIVIAIICTIGLFLAYSGR
jgi:glucose uptake protein GlcU